MKIYLFDGQTETGPYTKPEIFALLKDGAVTMDSPARVETESEYAPLSEVLQRSAKTFFSVAEIEQRQIESTIRPVVVPDLPRPAREPTKETFEPKRNHRLAAVLIAAATTAIFILFNRPDEPPQEIAEVATVVEPKVIAQKPVPTPSSTPGKVAHASTPAPTPKLKQIEIAQAQPTPDSALELALQAANPTPPPPEPTPQEPSYEKVDLAGSEDKGNTQLWVATFSPKSKGVILLCMEGPIVSDKPPMSNWTSWKAFARDNDLALAMIGFHESEKKSSVMLETGLRELGSAELPMFIYGVGSGGRFVTEFAPAHLQTVKGWASFDNSAKPNPARGNGQPALFITDYETSKITELRKKFEEGRSRKQRWTLLTIASDPKKRRDDADAFVRSYFQALIDYREDSSQWVSIDRVGLADPVDLVKSPEKVAWLPSQALVQSWRALMPKVEQTFDPVVLKKKVKTNVSKQPELEMFLRLPPKNQDSPPPSGVLAFTTWTQNARDIEKQLLYRTDMKLLEAPGAVGITARLIRYAEQHNLAVLTWNSNDVWRLGFNTSDLSKSEQATFDRSFDRIANAWESGLKDLLKGTGIPDRDMLLYGISRGGMWAQRLALRMPHHFLAVHIHIATTFDTPTPDAKNMLWLLTTGERDAGYQRCIEFYHSARKLGYPVLFKAAMDAGHDDTAQAEQLGFQFFDFALDLRNARLKAAAIETNAFKRKEILDTPLWLSHFRNPPFVGDFLNQEMFPSTQVNMIPAALRVPLPTEKIAEAWNK